ncbi:NUDIX hydrolase [Shimia sp.]|uniref:NUDIX hydrolase n=1 Tax=Shimia sp. TaxID=1954381 RepID=UPI003297EADA
MSVSFRDSADSDKAQVFGGAKMALFVGARILTILRDDFDHIPWPGSWDFPGGGREEGESPLECVLRETQEEVGLIVPDGCIRWSRPYLSESDRKWFFAAHLPATCETEIALGSEGQCWELVSVDAFLSRDKAIPFLQTRLSDYLAGSGAS